MTKKYNYNFCKKACDYFFAKGNYRLFNQFYSLLKEYQEGKEQVLTVSDVRNSYDYRYHHTGSRRGYESRKGNGHVEKYSGKFGTGYVVISPRWDTTRYVNVEYYLA